jgi:hypothetical protein
MVEHVPIKSSLVRAVVEYLQELRAAEMEHELWVQREVALKPKA